MTLRSLLLAGLCLLIGAERLTPRASDLSTWWTFDGDYTDSSRHGINGTAQGAGNSFDSMNVRQGISSLSTTGFGYITYGNNLNLTASDPLTISLWMKRASTSGAATLVAKQVDWGPHTNKGWILINNGPDGIYWQMNAGVGFMSNELQINWSDLMINDGNWHHIALTKSSSPAASAITLYIDGVAIPPSSIDSDTLTQDPLNTTDLSVAGQSTGLHALNGNIDSVKIEKRRWSAGEVQDDFQLCPATATPPPEVPNLLWRNSLTLAWDRVNFIAGCNTTYDVMCGDLDDVWFLDTGADDTCLANDLSDNELADYSPMPPAGKGWFFLVRANNAAGISGWETTSDGQDRNTMVCQ